MVGDFLIKYFADDLFYWVSFFTAATAIIPLLVRQGQIFNKRYKWYKRLRWAGYLIIITSSLGIYFNSLQNIYNDSKSEKKEIALKDSLKKNYNIAIDTIQKRFIEGNKEIIKSVIGSLGVYGYKLDSANKNLVKIVKDSSKTRIITSELPVLQICSEMGISLLTVKDNSYSYKISFCSKNAGSTEFKVDCHVILIDSTSGKRHYVSMLDLLPKDLELAKDQAYARTGNLTTTNVFTDLCILVKGSYMNLDKTKARSINELYYYEVKNKVLGTLSDLEKESVIKFVQDNKSNWQRSTYIKAYN